MLAGLWFLESSIFQLLDLLLHLPPLLKTLSMFCVLFSLVSRRRRRITLLLRMCSDELLQRGEVLVHPGDGW